MLHPPREVWPPTSHRSAKRVAIGAWLWRPSFTSGLRPKGPKPLVNTCANLTGQVARDRCDECRGATKEGKGCGSPSRMGSESFRGSGIACVQGFGALPPFEGCSAGQRSDEDVKWPEHIIDATQPEMGDTESEDRYDSEEDMETPAFGPSKKRRTRRERSQAASRSLGPPGAWWRGTLPEGSPTLPPHLPSLPATQAPMPRLLAQGHSVEAADQMETAQSAWSYVPDQEPRHRRIGSSKALHQHGRTSRPRSGKTSSDTPGSEAHKWRSRGSSRKTTGARPASKVRSGSSRRTVLSMPGRPVGCLGRDQGRERHHMGRSQRRVRLCRRRKTKRAERAPSRTGPRPIDLKPHAEAEDTGEKHDDDEAMDDAGAGCSWW